MSSPVVNSNFPLTDSDNADPPTESHNAPSEDDVQKSSANSEEKSKFGAAPIKCHFRFLF